MTMWPLRPVLAALAALLGALTPAALPAVATAQEAPEAADRFAFTQDYEPAPAVWELSDEDTTIYMLGTIHLLPEGFRWRNSRLDAIIDRADELVVETSDADGETAMDTIAPKLGVLLEDRTPTSRQLSPASRPRWRELAALTGMPFEYVDRIPLMLALLGLGEAGVGADPSSYEYGVETVLEREFAESGRPIHSIEDFGRVMYGLFMVDDSEMIGDLDRQLRGWRGKSIDGLYVEDGTRTGSLAQDEYWAMEHAWARGEVNDDFDLGFGDGKIAQTFREVLLNRRNRHWAAWLDERLDTPGTVLLAVGAGHFEGDDSLLAWLEKRDLRVRRII